MVSPRRRSSRARSTTHQIAASSSSSSSSSRNRLSRHRTDEDIFAGLERNALERAPGADIDEANDSHAGDSVADEAMEDAGDTEDEITRCICGFQEYQGGDDETDTDGLFIQCDQCKVWQHGFCVGITDNEATPDNYYCEKCKPELHREGLNKAGLKTSIYLPAQEEPPKPSKEARRRTTMNSRDAEYDDEVLKRIMLEVSKNDAKTNGEPSSRSSRGRKRGSSEGSDDPKESKRSRASTTPESQSNAIADSSDEKPAKAPVNAPPSARKSRGNATRNTNTNSTSTKRTSARNRGGVEKFELRRDDSEHSDDYAPRKNNRSNNRKDAEEPVEPLPVVNSIPEPVVPDTPQQTIKRASRNGNTNGGRRRNGRHTRQSEDPHDIGVPMTRVESTSHGKHDNTASVLEKPTKPRLPAARITVNEMKKRVNSISEYITRTQVEMANTRQSDIYAYLAWMEEQGTPVSKSSTATPKVAGDPIPKIQINGDGSSGTGKVLQKASEVLSISDNFNALEIMEMLSTKINRWQQHYGEVL